MVSLQSRSLKYSICPHRLIGLFGLLSLARSIILLPLFIFSLDPAVFDLLIILAASYPPGGEYCQGAGIIVLIVIIVLIDLIFLPGSSNRFPPSRWWRMPGSYCH